MSARGNLRRALVTGGGKFFQQIFDLLFGAPAELNDRRLQCAGFGRGIFETRTCGDNQVRAAFANVTLVGPGRREVNVKLVLNVDVAAVTMMVPAFGPAVTLVEACPLGPVGADDEPSDALPLVTVVASSVVIRLSSRTDPSSSLLGKWIVIAAAAAAAVPLVAWASER